MLAFVYGSLKKGYGNNAVLGDSRLEGDATISGNISLLSLGSFPGLIKNDYDHAVVTGEVYNINDATLARLDQLEGNGHFYQREEKDVIMGNGAVRKAHVYFLLPTYYGERNTPSAPSSVSPEGVTTYRW